MSLTLNPISTSPAMRQARALVNGLNSRQRYGIGGGVLAVVVALLLFVHFMAKPDYSVLYTSLQPQDAQQVTAALSQLAIPYDQSADGTSISVPADQLNRARLRLAAEGLPHSGQLGFELFDKTNWSGSDFAEQVNYQRALEGELDRTIETIHGVRTASVQITMAHDSLFTSEARPAKAAVLLGLDTGVALDPSMGNAIRHLVASSVDHLSADDVAILDAQGDLLLADNEPGNGSPAQARVEDQLRAKIIATLAPIVGAAHVRASVSVAYDPTSGDDTQETYDPQKSAVLTSTRTSTSNQSAGASGVPGTTSNLPPAQAPGTNYNAQLGLSGQQGETSASETFAVSRTVSHEIRPAGMLQRVTAAVVVDDGAQTVMKNGHAVSQPVPRSPQEMQQFQTLVAAAIGINATRGDVLTVSNLPFLAPASVPAPVPPPPSATSQLLKSWWPIAAGAAALLLLLLFAGLALVRRRRSVAPPTEAAQLAAAQAAEEKALAAAAPSVVAATSPASLINVTELLSANPDEMPPEMQEVLQLRERLVERVKREPALAGKLVQVWMRKRREGHV